MGHNPSNRDAKKSEKKQSDIIRTPEERLSAIRGSLAAKLFVTPTDVQFLLNSYDDQTKNLDFAVKASNTSFGINSHNLVDIANQLVAAQQEIETLKAQIEQVRTVAPHLVPIGGSPLHVRRTPMESYAQEIDRFHDGGSGSIPVDIAYHEGGEV
jgi:hypothetical protein